MEGGDPFQISYLMLTLERRKFSLIIDSCLLRESLLFPLTTEKIENLLVLCTWQVVQPALMSSVHTTKLSKALVSMRQCHEPSSPSISIFRVPLYREGFMSQPAKYGASVHTTSQIHTLSQVYHCYASFLLTEETYEWIITAFPDCDFRAGNFPKSLTSTWAELD